MGIQSLINVIFMMEEMESCMAGTSQRCKRKKGNLSVVIIQIHSDTEKAREIHICIIANACDLPFYLGSPAISTILKVINFCEEFTQRFLTSNYAVVQSKRKLTFAKAMLHVPSIHSVQ